MLTDCDFGLAYGSMPQGRRPAVIVQNDNFYSHKKSTNKSTPQIGIVDKACLVEKVSKLSPSIMLNISAPLADLLAI